MALLELQPKLTIFDFGKQLIQSQDLDPVYCTIYRAKLLEPQLARVLLAYWCFYHLGVSAYISEATDASYWKLMRTAAVNKTLTPLGSRWPRGAERRHFRGVKCVEAIDWFSKKPPEHWVDSLQYCFTDESVIQNVRTWPLFGPWIAFKVADMLERCAVIPVEFDPNIGLLYDEPRKGLELWAERSGGANLRLLYGQLLEFVKDYKAPPALDRRCGPQEAETILCKWKSYMNGHYWVGKDIHEITQALKGWGKTADRMNRGMPKEIVRVF